MARLSAIIQRSNIEFIIERMNCAFVQLTCDHCHRRHCSSPGDIRITSSKNILISYAEFDRARFYRPCCIWCHLTDEDKKTKKKEGPRHGLVVTSYNVALLAFSLAMERHFFNVARHRPHGSIMPSHKSLHRLFPPLPPKSYISHAKYFGLVASALAQQAGSIPHLC